MRVTQAWADANSRGRGSRAGVVAQREYRFGLLQVERPAARRGNGTVEGAGGDEPVELPRGPHRHFPLKSSLHNRALPQVLWALGDAHAADLDFAPLVAGSPSGTWSHEGAVADLADAALAAPTPPSRPR